MINNIYFKSKKKKKSIKVSYTTKKSKISHSYKISEKLKQKIKVILNQ